MKFALPEFALSHFDATKHAAAIPDITPEEFLKKLNDSVAYRIDQGYAPFCKIFYYHNFTKAKLGIIPLYPEVVPFIQSGYEARRETELPVLTRWVPATVAPIDASYLGIVAYDREQMAKEGTPIKEEWGIVNILRLIRMEEPPMPPITMMRNALGVAEGGSGVPLDREKYLKSVEFWSNNIALKPS